MSRELSSLSITSFFSAQASRTTPRHLRFLLPLHSLSALNVLLLTLSMFAYPISFFVYIRFLFLRFCLYALVTLTSRSHNRSPFVCQPNGQSFDDPLCYLLFAVMI